MGEEPTDFGDFGDDGSLAEAPLEGTKWWRTPELFDAEVTERLDEQYQAGLSFVFARRVTPRRWMLHAARDGTAEAVGKPEASKSISSDALWLMVAEWPAATILADRGDWEKRGFVGAVLDLDKAPSERAARRR